MRTEEHETRTREEQHIARKDMSPDELWLDQDITGEELMALDPLEETEDLIALADEATGNNSFILDSIPDHACSDRLWQMMMRIFKAELRKQHGGTEAFGEFRVRLRGST